MEVKKLKNCQMKKTKNFPDISKYQIELNIYLYMSKAQRNFNSTNGF